MAEMKRILVAEDEKPLAQAVTAKLENEGFEVTVAHNGAEAIEALKKESFDLAILDLVMPDMDGFEVLESLQKDGNKTPAVVVSNLAQGVDQEKAEKYGIKKYFIKSNTSLSEIVVEIKKILT